MSVSYHIRSNSFPSKLHPFTSEFDEHLSRLRSSETISTSSVGQTINGLQDLYESVEKFLQLSLTRQSLSQDKHKKFVQDLLDGSLMLLDMCSVAKDTLSQTKDSTLEVQSILRRRRGDELNSEEVRKYMNSRKIMKKAIHKALKIFKVKENCTEDENHETKATINMLKEAEVMTFSIFKSLLSIISGPKAQSKLSGMVSKLVQSKRIACEKEEAKVNEFEKVDATLHSFLSHKSTNCEDILNLQNHLKDLEMCGQDLEEGLECLSRRLIKTRVTLLNILNN